MQDCDCFIMKSFLMLSDPISEWQVVPQGPGRHLEFVRQ